MEDCDRLVREINNWWIKPETVIVGQEKGFDQRLCTIMEAVHMSHGEVEVCC
jgi:hypothetical protein